MGRLLIRYCGSPLGCDGKEEFQLGGGSRPSPNWACPKCGWRSRSTQRLKSEVLELARDGRGEISAIDQQRIVLRELESQGKIDAKTAARHKRRLEHNEKTGKYRVTDIDRRIADMKAERADREEAAADRLEPVPVVNKRDAVEAARSLGLVPESDIGR